MKIKILLLLLILSFPSEQIAAQHSIAREWSELLLDGIRNDFARPTIHARNLFHASVAMHDAWSAYDTTGQSQTYLLGQTLNDFACPLDDFPLPNDIKAAREEAISFAVFRLMRHRFSSAPNSDIIMDEINDFMVLKGYDTSIFSQNYTSGSPAMLGNYIAECIIEYGLIDNSNEIFGYNNLYYSPINDPLLIDFSGNPTITDMNHWQPLTLDFIDQGGFVIGFNTPPFLSPEWGAVFPFALKEDDLVTYNRDNFDYQVYHDPGPPPYHDMNGLDPMHDEYRWGFELVSIWAAQHDPSDQVMIDISPGAQGNNTNYPTTIPGLRDFYDQINGGDGSPGRYINPKTGLAYVPHVVPRADYTRVLAEFWADGPDSETPPGHWYTILNYVMDQPSFEKRFEGKGEIMDDLHYDVQAYMALGAAMHDCAVSTWGIKGWYDYIRPVSAIRALGILGQATDPTLPSYHPGGLELIPGYIELVQAGDPLAGMANEHVNKIKLFTWKGPNYISNTNTDIAGVDWILAEDWHPYQRPSFVTPNFAGYISGHSTFSRAAAEVLTMITGDEYFPGGMGRFEIEANNFLVFEAGPSTSFELQWATYRDASDQCSLSRIYGGIHPPADDIPGRLNGIKIGIDAFNLAKEYFYNDNDGDGYYSYEDCNDENPLIYDGANEICDGLDNNCDGAIDEGLTLYTYYFDNDDDGFGNDLLQIDTCADTPPLGYVINNSDCDDTDETINPSLQEVCNGMDTDCNGFIDDGLTVYTYFEDADFDGFGNPSITLDTCLSFPPIGYIYNSDDCDDNNQLLNPNISEICDGIDNDCNGIIDDGLAIHIYFTDSDGDLFGDPNNWIESCLVGPPLGYVRNDFDCDDNNDEINPEAQEISDNGIDEDCNGTDLFKQTKIFPNPVSDILTIHFDTQLSAIALLYSTEGKLIIEQEIYFDNNVAIFNVSSLSQGLYFLRVVSSDGENDFSAKLIKK